MITESKSKRPRHIEVSQHLRRKILSWRAEPDTRKIPTESALAEMHGVSIPTVRQATKNLVAEGLLVSRQGSGTYISDEVVDGMRTIAIVWSVATELEAESPWHVSVYRHLAQALDSSGWRHRMYAVRNPAGWDRAVIDQLLSDARSGKYGALFSFSAHLSDIDPEFRTVLNEMGIAWMTNDPDGEANTISPDYHALGSLGLKHLAELGATRVGLFGGTRFGDDRVSLTPRHFGQMVADSQGMSTRQEWIHCTFGNDEKCYAEFKKMWSGSDKPDGLLVANDVEFRGITAAMLDLGVRHPDDLKLVVEASTGAEYGWVLKPATLCFDSVQVGGLIAAAVIDAVRHRRQVIPSIRVSPLLSHRVEEAPAVRPGRGIRPAAANL